MLSFGHLGEGAPRVGAMIPDIYEEMLKKLMKRTMKGQVHWKLSPGGDQFTLNFRAFSLSMSRSSNFIQFMISDADDKGVDDFRITNTEKEWDKIAAFYNQIRSRSPDINSAIKAIMEELEGAEVVGLGDVGAYSEGNKKIYKIVG